MFLRTYPRSRGNRKSFYRKVNSRCFCWFPAAILVYQNGTPIWRLHTKLHKGAWNVKANNSETVAHKVPNGSLTERFLKEERNTRCFFRVIIYWKTTIKEIKDRIAASEDEIDRDPETYRLSEKEQIDFAVVVYISPKDTDMELKLKSIQKQSYGHTIRRQIWRF